MTKNFDGLLKRISYPRYSIPGNSLSDSKVVDLKHIGIYPFFIIFKDLSKIDLIKSLVYTVLFFSLTNDL
uniref:Uncharacterized protein n=1 Tax=Acidianus brierleyi TaxID=41673 RepID=A0A2U9IBE7_9CREN